MEKTKQIKIWLKKKFKPIAKEIKPCYFCSKWGFCTDCEKNLNPKGK